MCNSFERYIQRVGRSFTFILFTINLYIVIIILLLPYGFSQLGTLSIRVQQGMAQFSLYVHKGGLMPDTFHFILQQGN